MKPINKDELFQNLSEFLKSRGVEFKEGSYAQTIRASCSFLTDAINLGQEGLERAKGKVDKQLDQMRQAIHEMTAPKPSPTTASAPPPPPPPTAEPTPPKRAKTKARARKTAKPRKGSRR